MCIQDNIQSKIAELTNNGEDIALFLADTLSSPDPGIKYWHRLEAARMLDKYRSPQQSNITPINPTHPVHPVSNGPTLRDIVAYPVARYIRNRTNDGETLLETLREIMHGGRYNPSGFSGEPLPTVKRHHRLSAAKEIMRRAFGECRPPRSESIPSIQSIDAGSGPLNTDLAKLVRERTNDGTEAAELLIRIAENGAPEDEWTSGHRLSASKELLHRAYDLNYDAVTWEHIEAYRRAVEADFDDTGAELERARIEKGREALLREFSEAYEAGDEEAMQAAEDKFNAYNRRVGEGEDPDEALAHTEYGPGDPDPDVDYYYPPLSPEEQARFDEESRRNSAADIHTLKLTIPLNIRSP